MLKSSAGTSCFSFRKLPVSRSCGWLWQIAFLPLPWQLLAKRDLNLTSRCLLLRLDRRRLRLGSLTDSLAPMTLVSVREKLMRGSLGSAKVDDTPLPEPVKESARRSQTSASFDSISYVTFGAHLQEPGKEPLF